MQMQHSKEMKNDYKRLGDYIREVDVRNRDLEVRGGCEKPGFGGEETIGCQHLQRIHAVHSEYHRNRYVFL